MDRASTAPTIKLQWSRTCGEFDFHNILFFRGPLRKNLLGTSWNPVDLVCLKLIHWICSILLSKAMGPYQGGRQSVVTLIPNRDLCQWRHRCSFAVSGSVNTEQLEIIALICVNLLYIYIIICTIIYMYVCIDMIDSHLGMWGMLTSHPTTPHGSTCICASVCVPFLPCKCQGS